MASCGASFYSCATFQCQNLYCLYVYVGPLLERHGLLVMLRDIVCTGWFPKTPGEHITSVSWCFMVQFVMVRIDMVQYGNYYPTMSSGAVNHSKHGPPATWTLNRFLDRIQKVMARI